MEPSLELDDELELESPELDESLSEELLDDGRRFFGFLVFSSFFVRFIGSGLNSLGRRLDVFCASS